MTPFLVLAFVIHPVGLLGVLGSIVLGFLCLGTLFMPTGVFSPDAVNKLLAGDFNPLAASGPVNPHQAGKYVITKAGVAALTLAAPTAGLEDGLLIEIISTTANAHTLTATGLFRDGSASVNLATFANQIGASIVLQAYQGKWYVSSTRNVTMS